MKRLIIISALSTLLNSCLGGFQSCHSNTSVQEFGNLSDGTPTKLYTIVNSHGASVSFTDYGLRITNLIVPDRNGNLDDVIVGFGDIKSFELAGDRFVGCVLGRYANRISGSSFNLCDVP